MLNKAKVTRLHKLASAANEAIHDAIGAIDAANDYARERRMVTRDSTVGDENTQDAILLLLEQMLAPLDKAADLTEEVLVRCEDNVGGILH